MRVARLVPNRAFLVLCVSLAGSVGCGGGGSEEPPPGDTGPEVSIDDFPKPPESCALNCGEYGTCEPKGYECPALAAWERLPHADACGAWNGTFPAVTGKCTASTPSGEAAKPTGVDKDDPATTILPTGQRAKAEGKVSVFADFKGQFPTNVIAVPGSDLFVVIDGGIQEQSVRLVDSTKIGTAGDPAVGREKFVGSTGVNYGAAIVAGTPLRLYVSGSAGSVVYGFKIDPTAKTLTRDADADIKLAHPADKAKGGGLGGEYMLSGLAASPDGKRLYAGTQNAPVALAPVLEIDIDPASGTYKKMTRVFELSGREIFTLSFHPADTAGKWLWVSVWDQSRIDLVDLEKGTVKSLNVGKNPQAIVPLGTQHLAVVASDADEIDILDTLAPGGSVVSTIPIVEGAKLKGFAPSGVAYDQDGKRLYVTLAGLDAVAAYDVTIAGGAPTLVPAGMFSTEWWPTAVAVRADKSVVVVNGKGRGTGANPIPYKPSEGDITDRMHGSIQLVPPLDATALAAGKTAVEKATNVGQLAGASRVDCAGAPYDFPIPETNTAGPSKQIKHVVFVVKENKTFDGVFGDLPGVAGDPKLVMAPGQMEAVFGNQRKLAKTFTLFDNYYTSAEQSIQGHVWTAYGRTTEYIERTWLVTWGRGYRGLPTAGITPVGQPSEGSLFSWLQREGVPFDNMGEPVGAAADDGKKPKNCCFDPNYPGTYYAMDLPDPMKACYVTARARVLCDLKAFSYALFPNDHTSGGSGGQPTPQTYIAVGDEGTGLLVDGLSRSPIWNETLVIVTEDDPQDGGDHVDAHRTPFYMASPWVKRGYVAKGHYDTSSIHKLLAHIYGKSYFNEAVARAALPLEAFTSTPDYTPFDHLPRSLPLACNPKSGKAAATAAMSNWDFSKPDQAPGIGRQVWEIMHEGAPLPVSPGAADDDD